MVFFFFFCCLGIVFRTPLPNPRTQRFTPVIYSRVLDLKFSSLKHFELIFIWCERGVSARGCPVVLAPFVEKTVSSVNGPF